MPPKKQTTSNGKAKKEAKKLIEDKTFGMKNKNKSAKVNKYIQSLKQQAESNIAKKVNPSVVDSKLKKEEELKRQAEIKELFKSTIIQTKVPFGVDPKSVLCNLFKNNVCDKGLKCKLSHDLNISKKNEKIDLYTDPREKDTTESIIKASRVCEHFLKAVTEDKYGWFWECPNNGKNCEYKHCLPQGYIINKKEENKVNNEPQISIEEFLEIERHKLTGELTKVTQETFKEWKINRNLRKEKEEKERAKKKAAANNNSGRELFVLNPDWAEEKEYDNNENIDEEEDVFDISQYTNNNNDSVEQKLEQIKVE